MLLVLAVLLLGFIVAIVIYDLNNRNKQLHHYTTDLYTFVLREV